MKKKLKDVTVGEFYEHFENHQYINCYKCPLNSFKYYGKKIGCYCDIKACDIIPELLDKEINLVLDSESIKKKFRDITVKEFYEHFKNWECIKCDECPLNSYEYFYGGTFGIDCDLLGACDINSDLLEKEVDLFGISEQVEEEE